MGVDKIIRNRLAKMEGRIRREGRRLASVLLCASLVMGNLTVTPFSILADDESGDYDYEFDRMSLKEALRTALSDGATLEKELNFDGQYAEEYDKLLTPDGTLYELFPEETEKDRERDKVLDLRIFARVQGSIPVEDTYVFDGSEEIVFLLTNKTDKTQTATIYIDEMQSETITVLPADSVAVDDESSNSVVSGLHSSGGGSGSGSGSASGSAGTIRINNTSDSIQLDGEIVQDSDVTVLESKADTADKENTDHPAADDSDIVIDDFRDQDNGQAADTDSREHGMEAAGKEEKKDSAEAAKEDKEVSGSDSGADKTDDNAGADTDNAGADIDDTSADIDDIGTDTDDVDNNSADDADGKDDADVEDNDNNDETDDSDSSDVDDSTGDTSDDTSGSSDSDELASISLHRTALLSTSIASASNAVKKKTTDDTASPSDATASDADRMLDGTLYEAVRLDKKGAVAFATTGADCRFDVIVLEEQEMTCESESSDQEYLVTVSGWLPQGATITAEPVDVEIEDRIVLLALDISIYDDNGEVFEPADDTISVTIESPEITSAVENNDDFNVYYVPEEGEPELQGTTETKEGTVVFDAEHFSVYVVTEPDVLVASGTMANGEGEEDAITWQMVQDEDGNYTLYVGGTGSIPDFTTSDDTPWIDYKSSSYTFDLVIEDGITRVGAYAFDNFFISDISFGNDVESIGTRAFGYLKSLTSVTIPGNIKAVESSAFAFASALVDITLEEGVQTIGDRAFGSQAGGSTEIVIPASVTSIGSSAFWCASGFAVSDENNYYASDADGVLYSKDMTTLVDYPNKRVAESWTVPAYVTSIQEGAFYSYASGTTYTEKLYVIYPITLAGNAFNNSDFSYIYISDDVTMPTTLNMFAYNNPTLTYIRLPENQSYAIAGYTFRSDKGLTYLKIPEGVTKFTGVANNSAFYDMTALSEIYYDAASATFESGVITDSTGYYDLTVGTNVDILDASFSELVSHAVSVSFEGENTIYIAEGALTGAPAPFSTLSGWIYVDEYGVIYQLDTETGTATLVYIPETYLKSVTEEVTADGNTIETFTTNSYSLTSITVPTSITVSDEEDTTVAGITFQVTAIGDNAAKYASNLTSITFEDASVITSLGRYALANCPLSSVTDTKTSTTTVIESEALAMLSLSDTSNVFYNTRLTGAEQAADYSVSMNGSESTCVEESGATLSLTVSPNTGWNEYDSTNGTGGYTALTGKGIVINIDASNNTGDSQTYRVYIRATEDDCNFGWSDGMTQILGDYNITVTCTACDDDPDVLCLEFTLSAGQTLNFGINALYPNKTSDGGGLEVWSSLVNGSTETYATREDTDGDGNKETVIDSIQVYWETDPIDYKVAKQATTTESSLSLVTDTSAVTRLNSNLSYTITLSAETTSTDEAGKDYVKYAVYTDEIVLPAGVTWDTGILEAINSGSYSVRNNVLYVGTQAIVSLACSGTNLTLTSVTASVSDAGNLVLSWRVQNTAFTSSDMSENTITTVLYADAMQVDLATYDSDNSTNPHTLTNTVAADVYYTYSSMKETTASEELTLPISKSSIGVSKSVTDASYLGEDITYTLSVYNTGAVAYSSSGEGAFTLSDQMSNASYIKAENMERMFAEAVDKGASLTITIQNACLGTGTEVTSTDGGTAYINSGNSDITDEKKCTLTITYDSVNKIYTVTPSNTSLSAVTDSSLSAALQALGYGVTSATVYTCTWTLSDADNNYTLPLTDTSEYYIYATIKDTFQYIGADWPGSYPRDTSVTVRNNAAVLRDNNNQVSISGDASNSVRREAYIDKSVSREGEALASASAANDGDVLDYTITFHHDGSGTYEDLPMVDDIYGDQYLLVEVEKNNMLSGYGLKTTTVEGTNYYILTERTYTNVTVGVDEDGDDMIAATITVSAATENDTDVTVGDGTDGSQTFSYTGVHTEIKWYFDDLSGEEYTKTVSYKTIVDMSATASLSYTIGNIAWMNDRVNTRIYASLWGGGTLVDFNKEIVTGTDSDTGEDIVDDDGETSVSEGQTVTYRLTLSGHGTAGTYVVKGSKIADALPETYKTFDWVKDDNVTIRVEARDESGSVTGYEDLATKWTIEEQYGALTGDNGNYYICWSEDVTVTFEGNAVVYIYVTLTFPTDDENSGKNLWTDYVAAVGGATIENTFYVYNNPVTVSHVLKESGSARLQKGVYALLRSSSYEATVNNYVYYYATGSSRAYYNTHDSDYRYALYYVELYNGGDTLLYLNDLYDSLPDGFSYVTLVTNGQAAVYPTTNPTGNRTVNSNSITTLSSGSYYLVEQQSGVTYMSAGISASVSDTGKVVFHISDGSGTNAVKYDSERDQYYLEKGQAIVFGIICCTGEDSNANTATNTIGMSYTDYTEAGVEVFDNDSINNVQSGEVVNGSSSGLYNDLNDGSCSVKGAADVSGTFSDETGNSEWLVSEVTLQKGGIKPGVIKETVSYTDSGNGIHDYENHVSSTDIVNWEVTLQNSGEMVITNYTVTDELPYPYLFTGDVNYTVYDSNGVTEASGILFTVDSVTLTDGSEVSAPNTISSFEDITEINITYQTNDYGATRSASIPVDVTTEFTIYNAYSIAVKFSVNGDGNMVMEIGLKDVQFSIPESGQVVLDYSGYYTSNTITNVTYMNQVTLTPSQTFNANSIQSGIGVEDGSGETVGVYNLSPVTVAIGYYSDAYKTVVELSSPSNVAVSTDTTDNSIVLSSADSKFSYTLSVENPNSNAMSSLILIDNLPYEGDSYAFNENIDRGSDFQVILADDDFTVTVTTTDLVDDWNNLVNNYETIVDEGKTYYLYTLSRDMYTVQYSTTKTGNYSRGDREGTSTDGWVDATGYTGNLSDVTSIRVIINAINDIAVPHNATISFTFHAKVTGETEPGDIAWNNFGYHYKIATSDLEAMPLSVGVKVPSAPELTKKLVDLEGNTYTAESDTTYTFVVYKGEEVTASDGRSYTSQSDLVQALTNANREYRIVTVTVANGDSQSAKTILTGTNGLDANESWWNWIDGEKYTIAEFLTDGSYSLRQWDVNGTRVSTDSSYTFTYDAATTLGMTCENTNQEWELELTKVDASDSTKTLGGAVFALYTMDVTLKMEDTAYNALSVKPDKEITVGEGENAVTWYLYSTQTSATDDGTISWTGLTEGSYYLVEVKAPDGYNLSFESQVISRSTNKKAITVTNTAGSDLPETGGPGTAPFRIAGLLLSSCSAYLIYQTLRRRRRWQGI